jgi:hypothetical protein
MCYLKTQGRGQFNLVEALTALEPEGVKGRPKSVFRHLFSMTNNGTVANETARTGYIRRAKGWPKWCSNGKEFWHDWQKSTESTGSSQSPAGKGLAKVGVWMVQLSVVKGRRVQGKRAGSGSAISYLQKSDQHLWSELGTLVGQRAGRRVQSPVI